MGVMSLPVGGVRCPGVCADGGRCQALVVPASGPGVGGHWRTAHDGPHIPGCDEGAVRDVLARGDDPAPVVRALHKGSGRAQDWIDALRLATGISDEELSRWSAGEWERWARFHAAIQEGQPARLATGLPKRVYYSALINPGDKVALTAAPPQATGWRRPYPCLGEARLAADMRIFDNDYVRLGGDMFGVNLDAVEQVCALSVDQACGLDGDQVVGPVGLWGTLLPDGEQGVCAQVTELVVTGLRDWGPEALTDLLGEPTTTQHDLDSTGGAVGAWTLGWSWAGGSPERWWVA